MTEEIGSELIPSNQATFLPVVVDESGKLLQRTDITQFVVQLAQLAQLARMRISVERADFEGKVDSRTLSVTDERKVLDLLNEWPYTPWISAFIFNDGRYTAKIAINEPWKWLSIRAGGSRTINHSHAANRIERIYYECDKGQTASVTIEAHY